MENLKTKDIMGQFKHACVVNNLICFLVLFQRNIPHHPGEVTTLVKIYKWQFTS